MYRQARLFRVLAASLLAAACAGSASDRPRHVVTLEGFDQPESAKYDREQDVWFVSNIVGFGSVKDDNGYIARVDARLHERGDVLVRGGVNGVELHAPKGMVIQGDTLWVADIDVLRGFHRRTGSVVATVDLAPYGAMLLNALTIGPDGEVVITDSAIRMTEKGVIFEKGSRIFAVKGRAVTLVAEGDWLIHPNGIAWDPNERRYVVASFNPHISEVYGVRPGDTSRTTIYRHTGRFDGLLLLEDGRVLVTSWPDSAVYLVDGDKGERLAGDIWQPADIGWDPIRGQVGIPSVLQGRVHLWTVPGAPRDREMDARRSAPPGVAIRNP